MAEIFISYASADAPLAARVAEGVRQAGHLVFVDSDRENGISPGAAWQKTLLHELRRCDAVVFLNSSSSQASMWCHSELVVAIEQGKTVYSLDLAPDVPSHPLVQALQGIRFETTLDASILWLTDNLRLDGMAQSPSFKLKRGRSPYPGLAAMDVADAGVFFGREKEVRGLADKVNRPFGQPGGDLVVVIGPSGAGKSSLVRAGLVAQLAVPRSGWVVPDPFEPGTWPLRRLASRLAALVPGQLTDSECRDQLLNEGIAAVGEWLADHTESAKRLLITVDQTEQLTTAQPQDAGEFLAVLGGGLGESSPVTVVMTVRTDRLDEIQRLPVVGPLIHESTVIAPMSRSQLAAVIEGPAQRADLTFGPGLVSRLIDDAVRGSSKETVDALPFLAFTLREMYDLAVRDGRDTFTDADYEQVGRIEGAIMRRTEAAESLLPPDSGPVLEHLLPRFVTLSEDRRPAGRPVPRERLTTAEQTIVQKLEDQRLLTGTGDTVRLAHEQLITAWPRLAQTVDDRRDDLLLQARIERQASDWKDGNGELLGRDATTTASLWLAERAEPGTDRSAIGDYIHASRRALRRRRVRLISVLTAVAALAVAASVFAVVAGIQRTQAVQQRDQAIYNQTIAEGLQLATSDTSLAAQLTLAAYRMRPTQALAARLLSTENTPLATSVPGSTGTVSWVAYSPDGRTLATRNYHGTIQLWNVANPADPQALGPPRSADGGGAYSVAFSPDGRTLATGGYDSKDGTIQLWNVADPAHARAFGQPLPADGNAVDSVAFSPDGRTLATGGYTGMVHLWDVADPAHPRAFGQVLRAGARADESVAFSPNGRMLATGNDDGTIQLWDVANPAHPKALGPSLPGSNDAVERVAFSPDGILATGDNGTIILWDVADPAHPQRLGLIPTGSTDAIYSVAFSPDGRTLAAGIDNGTIQLWDLDDPANPQEIGLPLTASTDTVFSVAFSPDGHTLASGNQDSAVRLWNIPQTILTAGTDGVFTVAFSPDGHTLATGGTSGPNGTDGATQLWNVADPAHPQALGPTLTTDNTKFVESVAFSPAGHTLAVGGEGATGGTGGTIQLWDVADPAHPQALGPTLTTDNTNFVESVAFSSDGQTLASGNDDGTISLWDVADPAHPQTLGKPLTSGVAPVESVAFSPDGRTLAVGGEGTTGGITQLWDVADPAHPQALRQALPADRESSYVYSVAFSPDGRTLAAGAQSGKVQLWNVADPAHARALGHPLAGEVEAVESVAFSPDGRTLAVGGHGGAVRLWDVADPAHPQALGPPITTGTDGVKSVAFSPNGLATGGRDGIARLWNLNVSQAIKRICTTARNDLTAQQWRTHIPQLPYQPPCSR